MLHKLLPLHWSSVPFQDKIIHKNARFFPDYSCELPGIVSFNSDLLRGIAQYFFNIFSWQWMRYAHLHEVHSESILEQHFHSLKNRTFGRTPAYNCHRCILIPEEIDPFFFLDLPVCCLKFSHAVFMHPCSHHGFLGDMSQFIVFITGIPEYSARSSNGEAVSYTHLRAHETRH